MRRLVGSAVGVGSAVILGVDMLPVRAHMAVATAGLVLVVPVVLGVVLGGFAAGALSLVVGFLVFDLLFIPPYLTLSVGNGQDWVVLGVYVVVLLLVARVVAVLADARAESNARAANARRLFELSELLVANKPMAQLGQLMVEELGGSFGLRGVSLVVPMAGRLEEIASAGQPLSAEELAGIGPGAGVPVTLNTGWGQAGSEHDLRVLALSTLEHPIGLLVLRGAPSDPHLAELLPTLGNELALALERAELHERALRAEVLEEMDRLRQGLVGAVSHDLRTPLATIKVASSTLLDSSAALSEAEVRELHTLIDRQADRLGRLVTNLLDMTRLEAGVLTVSKAPWSVLDLTGEAMAAMRPSLAGREVQVALPEDLPPVDADHLLVGQVLANLIDNADRHAPTGTAVTLGARRRGNEVVVSVSDQGKGVPPEEREAIFERFVRFDTGGRAGLGLSLSKTFVEAHGGRIWVEEAPGGGARFAFTLPVSPTVASA